jgi:hypothetical protein
MFTKKGGRSESEKDKRKTNAFYLKKKEKNVEEQ